MGISQEENEMNRIEKIKAYDQRCKDNAEKKRALENEKKTQLEERIRSLYPRINELIETANACIAHGIEINAYGKNHSSDYDKSTKGTFVTNYISHRIGFVMEHSKCKTIYEMGINAGGYCGEWNFRTDGENVIERHENGDRIRPATIRYMERFINEFDEFERDFYGYIDGITNQEM